MWAHPATQANLELLRARGVTLLGPGVGDQACGDVGAGRMLEPEEIVAALANAAPSPGLGSVLAGRRVLVSAGPTLEDIDPVRFIGNRSSGRMGFAIAQAAQEMAAEVILVAGPGHLPTPAGVRRIDVRSAQQMHDAVLGQADWAHAYIGAAAVSDYRPKQVAVDKIKKAPGDDTLVLERTPDILMALSRRSPRPFLVGFAAETRQLEQHAKGKLADKGLDMIAANQVGDGLGFASQNNALTLFTAAGERIDLGHDDKLALARRLLQEVAARLPDAKAPASAGEAP
jgi:phosphopantothenoylcysteine decarboxylase/phosphopantothenate--cysteine ligase